MNKQSNVYTIIYIIIVVFVVGTLLAFTAMSLRSRQQDNAAADKMKQILAAVHVVAPSGEVSQTFGRYIVRMLLVDEQGNVLSEGDASDKEIFNVDVAEQLAIKDAAARRFPVYVCKTGDDTLKYILAAAGNGLWGPIWGYVALDADGSTVYGAYFSHQGETPGLGAEIEKPAFQDEFVGKEMFKGSEFLPVTVVKAGMKPADGRDYVDGISGGTITSKGVAAMLDNCMSYYSAFLQEVRSQSTNR